MDKRCFVIVFSFLVFVCDAKSVSCDGSSSCQNSTRNGTENSTIIVSHAKDELEELRENVGKVGNKLEGIVYEVLKDILQDDFTFSKEHEHTSKSPNELVKETDKSTTSSPNEIKPTSLSHQKVSPENEIIHSNRSEAVLKNETAPQNAKLENPLLHNYQYLASNIPTSESDPTVNSTLEKTDNVTEIGTSETSTIASTSAAPTEQSRIKRMIHETTDQTRSVESFLESNQDKNFREESSRNQLDEPVFIGDISMPRDEVKMRSKEDVRRDPKKEPTEGNKSKRPQDEVSMRHLPMIDNPPNESIETNKKTQHEEPSENDTIESTKKLRPSPENQRSPRRKMIPSDEHPDQYQNTQEKKKVYRKNDGNTNQRSNSDVKSEFQFPIRVEPKNIPRYEGTTHRRTHSNGDMEVPVHRETKKAPIKNEDLVAHRSNQESMNSRLTKLPEMKKITTDENARRLSTSEETGDSRLGQSYMWANQPSNCYEKNNREDMLEKQHIEDLKYEVTKLRSVVDLLKEQQRLINSFDGDKKNMNTQEMLQVLNQINSNNEKPAPVEKNQQYAIDTTTKAKHEELGQIKVQLKDAIDNLNRTKEILNLEHRREMNLETELKSQKTELNWLKLIIENFIIAQAKKKMKDDNNSAKVIEGAEIKTVNDTSIVGAKTPSLLQKKSHNRTIPSTVKMAEEKLLELESMKSRESDANDREINRRMKNVEVGSPKSRASSMSNLEKILDSLSDKQSKSIDDDDNFQIKLLDAVKQLRKKKEEESFTKDLLRKLQMNTVESKSDDMLLKFQKALKSLDTPQSKTDDLDIEDQLKVLQREINKLKPADDLNLLEGELKSPEENSAELQMMITKLIANNPQLQGMKLPPITPQQLIQLQKKFGKRPGMVPPVMGGVGVGNDFGVTPPASLMNAFSPGIGKVGPLYGPYSPNVGPYGPNAYGKDLDITSSLGSYPGGYGLGQDLSKIMSYGAQQSNSYSSSNGYGGPNDYSGNLGYFGANNAYLSGGSYGSSTGAGPSAYSSHTNNYPLPSLSLYGASKPPYGAGVMPGYSNMYSSPFKSYGKPQDGPYSMNPYNSQPLTYSNPAYGPKVDQYTNDKQTYGNNNFFQITQPSSYGSGPPAPYLPPKAIDASSPEKIYGNQPPYSAPSLPYASDKIEELKTQIYALQNAISTYNRPEYIQTAEDKSTIHSLEQQIEELKGIVNSLNGYSGEQQNYPSGGTGQYDPSPYSSANDPKPIDAYNRDNEKKAKRSTQEEETKADIPKTSEHTEHHNTNDLWDKITSFFGKTISEGFDGVGNKTRRKRSVDDNAIEDGSSSNVMDKLTTVLREVLEDDADAQAKSPFGFGPTSTHSMNPLSRSSENQQGNAVVKQTSLQDIKKQIDHLKKQLGTPKASNETPDKLRAAEASGQSSRSSARHAILPEPSFGFNYALNQFPSDLSVKPKKLDIFKEIVAKVMDKVIESLPVILQKLFGFAVHELTAYGDDYGAAYGADSSYLSVFRNLGIFGYLPLILLRVVNAISTFIYILQKNKFLKYFLVPAGVVLLVTGGMVFLIWWMQPGDYYINYDKLSYDKETNYGSDYYSGDYGKNNGQIVKTYGVEDGKSRIHTYNHGTDAKPMQANGYPAFYKPNLVGPSENQMPVYNE